LHASTISGVAARDIADLAHAKLRQYEPPEHGATLADGAQPVALTSEVFLDNRFQCVALGLLRLAPLAERVSALGDGTQDGLRFLARVPQGQLGSP
jgi:hypothetical protein